MRVVSSVVRDLLERAIIIRIPMVWIATSGGDSIGLWAGPQDERIIATDQWTDRDERRLFHAGGVLEVGPYRAESGLNIRPTTIRLSAIDEAVLTAFRQYDARGARVQAWERYYDPDTRRPVKVESWFKGWINTAPSERPTPGGEAAIEVEVVSAARTLTITSDLKKSDAAQQKRNGDRIRRYKGTAANWAVPWGAVAEVGGEGRGRRRRRRGRD